MSTRSPRQLWLLPVLLISVIATALGALIARDLYDEPAVPPSVVVEPSTSTAPPSGQPGPPDVQGTADAVSHPLYRVLHPLLQTYFDAINARDYQRWAGSVTKERRAQQPEEQWRKEYGTTKDGSIVVYRIEAGGDGTARVLLRFTSTQAKEQAPSELPVECIHWNVAWPLEMERGEWKLAAGSTSATPKHEACA